MRAGVDARQCFTVTSCSGPFEFALRLPAAAAAAPLPVELEVDRAEPVPPDRRELGLAIQWIEVR